MRKRVCFAKDLMLPHKHPSIQHLWINRSLTCTVLIILCEDFRMAESGIISNKGKKIFKRILIGVFFTYVLLVGAFETWLGISQPENNQTITITTTNDAGEKHDRVVSRIYYEGALYVAANHWPRAWWRHTLNNPRVEVTNQDITSPYTAVEVYPAGDEHAAVDNSNPLPLFFKILTGFPPRYFIRLDPR